jgi:hypothetical protein
MDLLGGQLVCRPCGTKFYIDASGHYALGMRPANLRAPDSFEPLSPRKNAFRGVELLERLPAPARVPLLVGVLVVACSLLVRAWSASMRSADLPDTLEGRATLVAESFARDQAQDIELLRANGSRAQLRKWIDSARPDHWEFLPDEPVHALTEVTFKDDEKGAAMTVSRVLPPGSSPPDPVEDDGHGPLPPGLDLPLYWSLDDSGGWTLDLERTARVVRSP